MDKAPRASSIYLPQVRREPGEGAESSANLGGPGIDPNVLPSNHGDEHDDGSRTKMQNGTSLRGSYRISKTAKVGAGYDVSIIQRY